MAQQRKLLWPALFDDADAALMPEPGVSVHGMKKLWRGIHERIEYIEPAFFGSDAGGEDDEGKRGPEKRRQVLAYVRPRLEVLRPWMPRVGSLANQAGRLSGMTKPDALNVISVAADAADAAVATDAARSIPAALHRTTLRPEIAICSFGFEPSRAFVSPR